jgi:hypothetical protein
MDNPDKNIERKDFDEFIRAIGSEIEQAQVKLISAANIQMLLHYWKIGNFILYNQKRLGWGSKVIDKISTAIREKYPERKGYSPRNLKYMCQFARLYPLGILEQLLLADKELEVPTIGKVISAIGILDQLEIGQEPPAQIQMTNLEDDIITQEVPAQLKDLTEALAVLTQQTVVQIETNFICSPVSKINWASHMVMLDSKLPLGIRLQLAVKLTTPWRFKLTMC